MVSDYSVSVQLDASGDIGSLLVDSLLEENGISPSQVTFRTGIVLPAVGRELADGAVDAAPVPVPEPFTSSSEQEYGVEQLADLDQSATQGFPIEGYAVTRAWARKYPHTLQAFVRALEQGRRIADTDRVAIEGP